MQLSAEARLPAAAVLRISRRVQSRSSGIMGVLPLAGQCSADRRRPIQFNRSAAREQEAGGSTGLGSMPGMSVAAETERGEMPDDLGVKFDRWQEVRGVLTGRQPVQLPQ